jgi:hypothetical protein
MARLLESISGCLLALVVCFFLHVSHLLLCQVITPSHQVPPLVLKTHNGAFCPLCSAVTHDSSVTNLMSFCGFQIRFEVCCHSALSLEQLDNLVWQAHDLTGACIIESPATLLLRERL